MIPTDPMLNYLLFRLCTHQSDSLIEAFYSNALCILGDEICKRVRVGAFKTPARAAHQLLFVFNYLFCVFRYDFCFV